MSRASSIASEFGCVFIISSSVADPDPSDPSMFLGLLDPDTDPLVRDMDPDPGPDPSIIKQQ
jgi:hypothetical protein